MSIDRTRESMTTQAILKNWKVWGKMTKKHGSSYQCFRRGNEYLWIGYSFVERSTIPHALPYKDLATKDKEIEDFIS